MRTTARAAALVMPSSASVPSAESRSTMQFGALMAILVVAPWPLGGNRPWALALLGIAIASLFIWHLLSPPSDIGEDALRAPREARWSSYAMAAWIVLLFLQLVPLPAAFVSALNFDKAPRFATAHASWTTVSIDPYSTRLYLLKAMVLFAYFWLLLRLACTPRRLVLLARVVVFCGCLQALVGIALFALGARYSIFFVNVQHSTATGTYVNHNHYAGYLEMTLAVGIGLLMSRLDDRRTRDWRQWVRDWLAVVMSEKARVRVMLLIMVIALIASRSRMGNAAFLAGLLIAGVIALAFSKRSPRPVIVLLASLVVLDIVMIGSIVGVENVMRRIEQTRLLNAHWEGPSSPEQDVVKTTGSTPMLSAASQAERQETLEQRTEAARAALPAAAAFPLLGTGGGTFHLAFLPFRPPELRGYFDHVHNDFVEFAVETGLMGFALLAFALAASVLHAVRILARRRDPLARGMAFAALMGIVSLTIHSAVDFNLQILANALTFLVLVALPYLAGRERRAVPDRLEFGGQSR